MPVTQAASSAFEQHHLFVVLFHLAYELARLAVIDHRSARHLDDLVFAVLTERTALTTLAAIRRHDVLLILQMQQRP